MTRQTRGLTALVSLIALVFTITACGDKKQETSAPAGGDIQNYGQKAEVLEAALREDPNNVGTLVQLGNTYYDWGQSEIESKGEMAQPVPKWSKAVGYYNQALVINPNDVNVRVDMANLMHFMGRGDEAIAEYRKAISIDPKHPQARTNLIVTLADAKQDYKGAVEAYEDLIKAIPEAGNDLALKAEVQKYRDAMKGAPK
ncbi:MAG: tetratricopeptide repeat protein [Nitrospirae bacterium]|nr:tetratricopeptide repeat protein [Nitrospirota bacterium]MBI5696583.1 tetratricopeptide repeat protein [Nitrospirota bacterium]